MQKQKKAAKQYAVTKQSPSSSSRDRHNNNTFLRRASLVADSKESACNAGDLGSIPGLKREWLPTPIFLPGEVHGQRSLAGYIVHGWQRVRHD